jgi:CPA1 family monovalent cation:H+ antiporter
VTGSAPPSILILFVALLVAMPFVAFVSRRLRLPYTVALVLVGLAVSALSIDERIEVSPGLVVAVLLPGLVFEAAYRLDGDELRRTFGGVALLAVPGVLISAAVVAFVLNAATGLPVDEAFLVGAIVSATDPVAVVSTMRRLSSRGASSPSSTRESLFNDGTAALTFVVALPRSGRGRRPLRVPSSSSRSASLGASPSGPSRDSSSPACSRRRATISSR